MLGKSELEINLQNEHGQTALHTAARFNIPCAAVDILRRSDVDPNLQSSLGSSPAMVAAKYASKQTLSVLVKDARVRMDVVDDQKRRMEDIIGVAILDCDEKLKVDIQFILALGNLKTVKSQSQSPRSNSPQKSKSQSPSPSSPRSPTRVEIFEILEIFDGRVTPKSTTSEIFDEGYLQSPSPTSPRSPRSPTQVAPKSTTSEIFDEGYLTVSSTGTQVPTM